jgi:hypothetical protein
MFDLPCLCDGIAMLLPCFAILLPCSCHAIAVLLPCSCHALAIILLWHGVAMFLHAFDTPCLCSWLPLACPSLALSLTHAPAWRCRALTLSLRLPLRPCRALVLSLGLPLLRCGALRRESRARQSPTWRRLARRCCRRCLVMYSLDCELELYHWPLFCSI